MIVNLEKIMRKNKKFENLQNTTTKKENKDKLHFYFHLWFLD